jgi:hypothetical protein
VRILLDILGWTAAQQCNSPPEVTKISEQNPGGKDQVTVVAIPLGLTSQSIDKTTCPGSRLFGRSVCRKATRMSACVQLLRLREVSICGRLRTQLLPQYEVPRCLIRKNLELGNAKPPSLSVEGALRTRISSLRIASLTKNAEQVPHYYRRRGNADSASE